MQWEIPGMWIKALSATDTDGLAMAVKFVDFSSVYNITLLEQIPGGILNKNLVGFGIGI